MLANTLDKVNQNQCIVEIFGLGYVGFPLAVRLAMGGFAVKGIDVNQNRIQRLQNDDLLDTEIKLQDDFFHCKKNGNLQLCKQPEKTPFPKIGIICVHTPIPDGKTSSNKFVKDAVNNFLNTSKKGDLIVLESSVGGGTTEEIQEMIESSGYNVGEDFGLCFCPERIDPQNKKWNLENIPRIIYCSDDISYKIIQPLYNKVNDGHLLRVSSPRVAEVVKSYENAFRLVNISLANELAILCDKLEISVREVIKAASTKPFGFMPFYPGAGAGGHCIPKDPKFLLDAAEKSNIEFSTIKNAFEINYNMSRYICDSIERSYSKHNFDKTILVLGLTYKPDVEDMRDSPGYKIIRELNNRKFKVFAHDPFYKPALLEKYLIENFIDKLDFESIDLNFDSIKNINGICIVQHHTKNKFQIAEIYEKSSIPYIYDCQSQLKKNMSSKTILDSLG